MVKTRQCRECGVPIDTTVISRLCSTCKNEHDYILRRNINVRRLGVRADLTVAQWKNTVAHFNNVCAYCQKRKWTLMEHYIPVTLGGGTTVSNCVPACISCNKRKDNHHPDQEISIPRKDMERVHQYLMSFENCPQNT